MKFKSLFIAAFLTSCAGSDQSDVKKLGSNSESAAAIPKSFQVGDAKLTVKKSYGRSFLKLVKTSIQGSKDFSSAEKCEIKAGEKIEVNIDKIDGKNLEVTLQADLTGSDSLCKKGASGILFAEHFEYTEAPSSAGGSASQEDSNVPVSDALFSGVESMGEHNAEAERLEGFFDGKSFKSGSICVRFSLSNGSCVVTNAHGAGEPGACRLLVAGPAVTAYVEVVCATSGGKSCAKSEKAGGASIITNVRVEGKKLADLHSPSDFSGSGWSFVSACK